MVKADILHIIFNYTPEKGREKPSKATLVSKLVYCETDEFDVEQGDYCTLNGFDVLVQNVEILDREGVEGRKLLCIAETIYKEEDYDQIVTWFIDNNWNVEDALKWYEGEDD